MLSWGRVGHKFCVEFFHWNLWWEIKSAKTCFPHVFFSSKGFKSLTCHDIHHFVTCSKRSDFFCVSLTKGMGKNLSSPPKNPNESLTHDWEQGNFFWAFACQVLFCLTGRRIWLFSYSKNTLENWPLYRGFHENLKLWKLLFDWKVPNPLAGTPCNEEKEEKIAQAFSPKQRVIIVVDLRNLWEVSAAYSIAKSVHCGGGVLSQFPEPRLKNILAEKNFLLPILFRYPLQASPPPGRLKFTERAPIQLRPH